MKAQAQKIDKQEVIDNEQEYVLGVYSRPPFVIERGEGSTLYDSEGNAYLDCCAGIAVNALGYNDAGIAQATQEALNTGVLHVSNLYHTAAHAKLAKLLCDTSFADKVHFGLTGADANEGAFKFARRYAREHGHEDKFEILSFSNAFHGRLFGSLAATPRPKYQEPFMPLMPGVRTAEFNNLASAEAAMNDKVCAIIVEPIQGEGGIHLATPEFLKGLRALADKYDALLIFDEVQCGVGRTGKLWAYEHYDVEPDILTAAKPLAGGLPIGAILMRQKVADAMHKGDHASTFAGGLATTHVAHHVVSRVSDPKFLADVEAKGKLLMDRLEELNSPHTVEIRGKGLIVGMELDIDTNPIVAEGYKHGFMFVNAGPNVLRFVPPLIITKEEIARVTDTVGMILKQF